jgi:hypothetical protein
MTISPTKNEMEGFIFRGLKPLLNAEIQANGKKKTLSSHRKV